jgi:autotransporter-associated beta strand protein
VLTRFIMAVAILAICATRALAANPNPGEPLFCQPQEGTVYLIVNGGAGVFTVDQDCYNNNPANNTHLSITTGQGGSLAGTNASSFTNYVYTPSTLTFVGLDTFAIDVTTVWNSAGGTGSAGGSVRPGGTATLDVTLNVISASVALQDVKNTAVLIPVPAGSISGCTAPGNPALGPAPGAIFGCITAIGNGSVGPAHGTLSASGNTLRYTPTSGFFGTDTFTYRALGVNNDGQTSLNSGDVTVTMLVTTNIDKLNPSYNASLLGGLLNPVFTGGTLVLDQPGATYSQAFTLDASKTNTIDQTGNSATFSGVFSDATTGGNLIIANSGSGGSVTFTAVNTYTGSTTINSGAALVLSGSGSIATSSGLADNGVFDISGTSSGASLKSLSGSGIVTLGSKVLTLTNANDTFAGTIGGAGGLTIAGGTEKLTGVNTYTGPTTVNGGVLDVEGAINNSGSVTVNAGGTLMGAGLVDPPTVTIGSGATLAPGNGTPGSSMTVAGNLALQSGAIYLVQVSPSAASFANVTGTATLGGATVNAVFSNGSYIDKKYTILTANGGVSGTFAPSIVNSNLPANVATSLSYDANDVFLNLSLIFVPPPNSGLNRNQQAVANTLVNFFNSTGSIPLIYGGMTAGGLTQASGELGTSAQQTTFNAMNQFTGLLTDPFIEGRGAVSAPASGATPFAEENSDASAYAATGKKRSKSERDAYAAVYTKAPPPASFDQRWSVWAAGFGGSQTTDGNAALGSNSTTSHIYGSAVGADYRFSPDTLAGFALAGGGTGFSIANGLGTGRSDLFQAGAYARHNAGPAYISGALAYGWQDITTDRIVTIAGVDHLRAEFNANAWSGRVEGGYRFAMPWIGGVGITPYAAGQFTTFDLPAYAEQVISGTSAFALAYAGKSVTDSRSELGIRTDKSFMMPDGVVTLRGRAAWAHDYNTDRSVAPTFQALPGASFVVNGAAPAADAALVTASAERKWLNGFSLAGTFEGEFSSITRSYAAKGVVRYQW